MTTRGKLREMLTSRGMFDSQAEEVLKIAIPRIESTTPSHRITWDRPANEYPKEVYNAMWLFLRTAAKEWIAENAPDAWFRPMFD